MPSRTQAPSSPGAGVPRPAGSTAAPVAPPVDPAVEPPAAPAATSAVTEQAAPGPAPSEPASSKPASTQQRTLWVQGRHPGRLVVRAATILLVLVALASLPFGNRIGIVFDVAFVLICVTAALWVRPSDFFTVGVLPPLLLAFVVVALAFLDRAAVARADDPLLQAVVSGLAHHSVALVTGYGLTLLVLALRQVALRNGGALRPLRGRAEATSDVS